MRKKYLSALLFGALLLASAGTFTSCSDYDDDIKNLQEQINTVVSDLESLKTKVDGLGGYVTDVKVENGKLVVTANGNTVSYDLPAGSEVADIVIKDGHLYVNNVDKGSVGSTVTVNEDGELLIDGKASGLKVGTEVIIKDASNGMYTISIDGQTIQLPMASASITVSVENTITNPFVFTDSETTGNGGIDWAIAKSDIDWKGPKGAIKTGDLLVGQINTADVRVLPVSFDLAGSELKLVNSEGKYAPVKVSAVKSTEEGAINTGSRAGYGAKGMWTLQIEPVAENMSTDYTDGENNLQYALSVDGTVVTDYVFVVDTEQKANDAKKVTFEQGLFTINGKTTYTNVPVDKSVTIKSTQEEVYDYMIAVNKGDESKTAGKLTIDGYTIKAASSLAGQLVAFDVTVIDVNGNTDTKTIEVTFGKASLADVTLATTEYKVTVADDKNIYINMGTVFSDLTDDQAINLNAKACGWSTEETEFLLANGIISGVTYYETLEDAQKGESPVSLDEESNDQKVRNIKYAKISLGNYHDAAKVGKYNLTFTLTTKDNYVQKVSVPVNVTLPKFEDLYELPTSVWNGSVVTLNLNNAGEANFYTAVKAKENVDNNKLEVATAKDKDGNVYGEYANGTLSINKSAAVNNEGKLVNFTANATYKFAANLKVKSSDFTVNPVSVLNGAAIENRNDKAASVAFEVTGSTKEFAAAADGKNGVAIKVKSEVVGLKAKAVIGGVTLTNDNVKFSFDNQGDDAKASLTDKGLKVEGLGAGNYTIVLTVSITDGINVITEVPVSISVKN